MAGKRIAVATAMLSAAPAIFGSDVPCGELSREACTHEVNECFFDADACHVLDSCEQIVGDGMQCDKKDQCHFRADLNECEAADAVCGHLLSEEKCEGDSGCFWDRKPEEGKSHCAHKTSCAAISHDLSKCNLQPECYYDAAWKKCRDQDDVFTPDFVGGVGWYIGDPCAVKDKKPCLADDNCYYSVTNKAGQGKQGECNSKPFIQRISKEQGTLSEGEITKRVQAMECGEFFTQEECGKARRNHGHHCRWNECKVLGVGYPYCQDTNVDVPEDDSCQFIDYAQTPDAWVFDPTAAIAVQHENWHNGVDENAIMMHFFKHDDRCRYNGCHLEYALAYGNVEHNPTEPNSHGQILPYIRDSFKVPVHMEAHIFMDRWCSGGNGWRFGKDKEDEMLERDDEDSWQFPGRVEPVVEWRVPCHGPTLASHFGVDQPETVGGHDVDYGFIDYGDYDDEGHSPGDTTDRVSDYISTWFGAEIGTDGSYDVDDIMGPDYDSSADLGDFSDPDSPFVQNGLHTGGDIWDGALIPTRVKVTIPSGKRATAMLRPQKEYMEYYDNIVTAKGATQSATMTRSVPNPFKGGDTLYFKLSAVPYGEMGRPLAAMYENGLENTLSAEDMMWGQRNPTPEFTDMWEEYYNWDYDGDLKRETTGFWIQHLVIGSASVPLPDFDSPMYSKLEEIKANSPWAQANAP